MGQPRRRRWRACPARRPPAAPHRGQDRPPRPAERPGAGGPGSRRGRSPSARTRSAPHRPARSSPPRPCRSSCGIADRGGGFEELLGLFKGRPEGLAAAAAMSATGRCVAKSAKALPHGVTVGGVNVIPGAADPRSPRRAGLAGETRSWPIFAPGAIEAGSAMARAARSTGAGPEQVVGAASTTTRIGGRPDPAARRAGRAATLDCSTEAKPPSPTARASPKPATADQPS